MKYCILIISLLFHTNAFSQIITWNRTVIDPNLTIALPGPIKRADTIGINKYELSVVSARTDSAIILVMASAKKANISARNEKEYEEALNLLIKGIKKGADEENLDILVSNIVIDKVPGKKVTVTGSSFLLNTRYYYLFLVNDYVYNIQVVLTHQQLSQQDSLLFKRLETSIDFTDNIMELGYRGENKDHSKKIIIMVSFLAFVFLIIFLFIRRL